MALSKTQTFFLQISSDMANLARVADFIAEVASKGRLTQRQSDDVQMAVDEAVTNVMEHAYGGRRNGQILITCTVNAREFAVEIRDNGKPFDPSQLRVPDVKSPLSERTIGGLGVFFMRKLMTRVEFSRDEAGNLTRMTKKLK